MLNGLLCSIWKIYILCLTKVATVVMVYLDTNIFLFFYLFFLILYFFSFGFFFFFFLDNEEVCDWGHMIYHMMWGHRPRLDKSWLEEARRIILRHIYTTWCSYERLEINTWWKHELHMDIRVGLFTVSTDYEYFV